jgi:fatty-acyl-CoA synthase
MENSKFANPTAASVLRTENARAVSATAGSVSYARGPDVPFFNGSIYEALARTAEQFPENDALIVRHQNLRLNFRQLVEQVERVAGGLAALGLKPQDRFGVWATNCAEWVLLQLAAARAGLVLVNVNPAYRALELAYVLKKSRMKALFLHFQDRRSEYAQILEAARRAEPQNELGHVVFLDPSSWQGFLNTSRPIGDVRVAKDDITNIQYTSGTTGSPKGVLLSHYNLVNNGAYIARALRLTERDRICVPVPMYHCFGCVAGTMASITTGAAMILPAPTFEPLATMEAVATERATTIYGVPTMFIAQLDHPEFARFDFSSLRTGLMAGAPCPIEIMKRVVSQMHCPQMSILYGQTESSPSISGSAADDPLEVRVSTVGKVFPNTEVKIVAPNGGTVPVGEQGELCARGYMVMKGYDGEPDATARAIDAEGWLHTGDLASMRPDGYLRITGRAKDMIIRGGENIYPREVEEFLYTHPKVADVQVVGLPDAKLGETVAAWIRMKPGETATEDDITGFCRGRIAHFKIPQYIRFVDVFPMTVTGKIQKFRIREFEIRERGLQALAKIETA